MIRNELSALSLRSLRLCGTEWASPVFKPQRRRDSAEFTGRTESDEKFESLKNF